MERFFPVVRSLSRTLPEDVRPFNKGLISKAPAISQSVNKELSPPAGSRPSSSAVPSLSSRAELNALLLDTLRDNTNPITHSDLRQRSDFVRSSATGHQRSEERMNRRLYLEEREPKLKQQRAPARSSHEQEQPQIFRNVRVYINGYLEGTTDIEIKRIVTEGGGIVVPTASRSTHIVTSTGLNGSKSHKAMASKNQRQYIVKPEWILESHAQGKRRLEAMYGIRLDRTSRSYFTSSRVRK